MNETGRLGGEILGWHLNASISENDGQGEGGKEQQDTTGPAVRENPSSLRGRSHQAEISVVSRS